MPQTDEWRVRCTTEVEYRYWYLPPGATTPTKCPVDDAHTIDAGLTVISEAASPNAKVNSDGTLSISLDNAKYKQNGSQPSVAPSRFPPNTTSYYAGRSDDIPNNKRLAGTIITYSTSDAVQDAVTEWQFVEPHYFAGDGMLHVMNGHMSDHLTYDVYSPATAGTSVATGTGTHAKLTKGAGTIWVPAGTSGAGSADWDLDLTEKLNAKVAFTKVVPVPADGDGYFDWDADTEAVTANGVATGAFDLYDADQVVETPIAAMNIMGSMMHNLGMPSVKPNLLLPHWKHRIKVTHTDNGLTLKISPVMVIARASTAAQ